MMIYLIDDKKLRQEKDYGWNLEEINRHSGVLIPIYNLEQLKEPKTRTNLQAEGNIILFHDSFFDHIKDLQINDADNFKLELIKYANEKKGWVVFFGGSRTVRKIDKRIAHIPVAVLYNNLKDFLNNVATNKIDLKYLVYGVNNPDIEEELIAKVDQSNTKFDEQPIFSNKKNILIQSGNRINIPVIINDAYKKKFTFDDSNNEITHAYLDSKVIEWFSSIEFDNIFIPLCFGPSLSDFNGLQMACHVRCTDTINQLKPIFIYGAVDYSYLIDNEYFNILKTKDVYLIDYTREAFLKALTNEMGKHESLTKDQLSKEVRKLKLDIPGNYYDSHHIANIWGMYRLLELEGIDIKSVSSLNNERNSLDNLYFKYLKTINNSTKLVDDSVKFSRDKYRILGPKIIGKIDLIDSKKKIK